MQEMNMTGSYVYKCVTQQNGSSKIENKKQTTCIVEKPETDEVKQNKRNTLQSNSRILFFKKLEYKQHPVTSLQELLSERGDFTQSNKWPQLQDNRTTHSVGAVSLCGTALASAVMRQEKIEEKLREILRLASLQLQKKIS